MIPTLEPILAINTNTLSPSKPSIEDISIANTSNNSLIIFMSLMMHLPILFTLIAILLLFIVLLSCIDAKCIRRNDFHNAKVLISTIIYFLDTVSDGLFALQITHTEGFKWQLLFVSSLGITFILSISFIIIPIFISLFQLYHESNKHWNKQDILRSWLGNNMYSLYIVSILTGSSFTGVRLCQSGLFNCKSFNIPLSKMEALHFHAKRIYSITFLKIH